jgi:hypothetical protein
MFGPPVFLATVKISIPSDEASGNKGISLPALRGIYDFLTNDMDFELAADPQKLIKKKMKTPATQKTVEYSDKLKVDGSLQAKITWEIVVDDSDGVRLSMSTADEFGKWGELFYSLDETPTTVGELTALVKDTGRGHSYPILTTLGVMR